MDSTKKNNSFKLFPAFCIGVFIGLIIKLFIIDTFIISGTSMVPTLKEGEQVWVYKLAYGLDIPFSTNTFFLWKTPKKYDIVTYMMNNRIVVKRCLGIEGESLEFSNNLGYSISIAGTQIPLTEQQYQKLKHTEKVPPNMIFAVGDNYSESVDSREYGFVSVKSITGKVLCK